MHCVVKSFDIACVHMHAHFYKGDKISGPLNHQLSVFHNMQSNRKGLSGFIIHTFLWYVRNYARNLLIHCTHNVTYQTLDVA